MDGEWEIGADGAVLIAVAGLLPPAGDGESLYRHLADLHAANGRGSVRIMLLLDRKNAPTPELPEDAADLAALRRAQSGRRLLGTNGGSLWLWCCLPQPGALGP